MLLLGGKISEQNGFRRKAIVGFIVAVLVLSSAAWVFAQSVGQASSTTGSTATSTDVVTTSPTASDFIGVIKDARDAQAWRNFLGGRLAWVESQTSTPSYMLTEAQYADSQLENYLLSAGYTQTLGGPITSPGQ